MRPYYYLVAILSVLFISCDREDPVEIIPTKTVQFKVSGITEVYTRAAIPTNVTDIYIWEGTTLLKHQVSTDSDFGTPTLALNYGEHSITFVASSNKTQSFSNGIWSTEKTIEVFAKVLSLNISATSSNTSSVELDRRSSKVQFINEDAIPNDVSKVHLTVVNHKSLDKDLKGGSPYTHEASADITTSRGKTNIESFYVNTITESATDEEDCNVMIEFLDASDNVLYHYERTVKLKANRKTILKGKFFQGNSSNITVNTEWLTDNVESLF